MRKNQKKNIYLYTKLNLFVVHLKLTQHGKQLYFNETK